LIIENSIYCKWFV